MFRAAGPAVACTFAVMAGYAAVARAADSPLCTFELVPSAQTFGPAGGSGSLVITTQDECSWTVSNLPPYIVTTSGGAGTGSGKWSFVVAANTTETRSRAISVGGSVFTLTQLAENPAAVLFWQNTSTFKTAMWFLGGQGNALMASEDLPMVLPASWNLVAASDFDLDSHPDLFWQNEASREVQVNRMTGPLGDVSDGGSALPSVTGDGWRMVGAGDFNGDGTLDLLWQNDDTREVTLEFMGGVNGSELLGQQVLLSYASTWRAAAVADFDGDEVPDIVWQDEATHGVLLTRVATDESGTHVSISPGPGTYISSNGVPGWRVIGASDFNHDGYPDLVWQNDQTHQVTVWYLRGTSLLQWSFVGNVGMSGWRAIVPSVAPLRAPIRIVRQPQSKLIAQGLWADLGVGVLGTRPRTFQWYEGASGDTTNPVPGATASGFTTPRLTAPTSYWVRVTNAFGSVDSAAASISIGAFPVITSPPQTIGIVPGQTLSLSVVATGTAPLHYQWYYEGYPVAGATSPTFTSVYYHSSTVWVEVSNQLGVVSSLIANVVGCYTYLSSQALLFNAAGGTGSVVVTTPNVCSWNVSNIPDFVTAQSPTSGTGSTTWSFAVAPNAGASTRSASIQIGSQTLTVKQIAALKAELLWQRGPSPTSVEKWFLGGADGSTFLASEVIRLFYGGVSSPKLVAAVDLDGNGRSDLIWQDGTVDYMGGDLGHMYLRSVGLTPKVSADWQIVATGDFNGDGHPDLVWENVVTRQATVWYMGGVDGAQLLGWAFLSPDGIPGWRIAAAADFNGDGKPDLVWQNDATREVTVWYMGGDQGATRLNWTYLSSAVIPGWSVVGAADFDGDGHPDLVWQDDALARVTIWHMTGAGGDVLQDWKFLSESGMGGFRAIVPAQPSPQ